MSSLATSSSSTSLGIALLRVSLGVMWIAHALLKLFVPVPVAAGSTPCS